MNFRIKAIDDREFVALFNLGNSELKKSAQLK